jgi:hypothetical protein
VPLFRASGHAWSDWGKKMVAVRARLSQDHTLGSALSGLATLMGVLEPLHAFPVHSFPVFFPPWSAIPPPGPPQKGVCWADPWAGSAWLLCWA